MDVTAVSIRPAEPEEAPTLTDIAMRSKATWGYDEGFMRAARAELTVTRDYVAEHAVFVVDERGRIGGFYGLKASPPTSELNLLFIDPDAHGKGYGRVLMNHAMQEARALGCSEMLIESDPHAEPFYVAMGAQRIGESPSSSPGRILPLLRIGL